MSGKKIKRESKLGIMRLNSITPCAACKMLRRKCDEDCPFAPYFSPDEPERFAAVHRVFGASNISKILMDIPESLRTVATDTLVYEANMRLSDPVYGCVGTISALYQQIQALQSQLNSMIVEIQNLQYREATNVVIDPPGSVPAADVVPMAAPSPSSSVQSISDLDFPFFG